MRKSTELVATECVNCGSDINHKPWVTKKYCNHSCQQDFQWKQKKISIEAGDNHWDAAIKRYLLEQNNSCDECGLGESWNNKPLTLQLDHIDGNSDNTVISNCRLLCPNCHTQTPTYGSKGQGKRYKKHTKRNKYLREYKDNGSLG